VATDEMPSPDGIVLGLHRRAAVRREMIEGLSADARSPVVEARCARLHRCLGPNSAAAVKDCIAQRQAWSTGRLQLDCVKMFLDGAPIEGLHAIDV